MSKDPETPESRRERMRQEELKGNPTGGLNDGFNRANGGSPTDLFGDMGWKGAVLLIVVLIAGFIIATLLL